MTGTRISLTIARLTAILRRSEFPEVKTLKNLGIPDCMKTPPRSITRMSCQDILAHTCAARKEIRSLHRFTLDPNRKCSGGNRLFPIHLNEVGVGSIGSFLPSVKI